MTTQLSLLSGDTGASRSSAPHLPAAVRTSDPRTSHAAARSMKPDVLGKQRSEALRVIKAYADTVHDGATAWDVARSTGYQQSVCARRCSDLHELGLIEDSGYTRAGSSNRQMIVWRPIEGAFP